MQKKEYDAIKKFNEKLEIELQTKFKRPHTANDWRLALQLVGRYSIFDYIEYLVESDKKKYGEFSKLDDMDLKIIAEEFLQKRDGSLKK